MKIDEYLKQFNNVTVAFSGGVDSAVLLFLAKKYCKSVNAVFIKSAFQPRFELEDAEKAAKDIGVDLKVISIDVLKDTDIISNSADRCYYCKRSIMLEVSKYALASSCDTIFDGTNASDDITDRAGTRALSELGVLSPLRICGLDKAQIRAIARDNGIFVHSKPSYACLATRIPKGMMITQGLLNKTEMIENEMFGEGFTDFRVRYVTVDIAKVQLSARDMSLLNHQGKRLDDILKKYFDDYTIEER